MFKVETPLPIAGKDVFRAVRAMGRPSNVAAQVSTGDIVDAFYHDFATEESGRYWWWCREILIDPEELIVEGHDALYRVPFTLGDDTVDFGEPREVRIQYVDALARADQVAAALDAIASVRGEKVAARFHERPKSRPKATSQEGGSMDADQLRSLLKLSADVPDEEVFKIARQRLSNQEPEDPPDGEEPEGGTPEPQTPGTGTDNEPATPAEGTVQVDAAALAELRNQASQGAEARRVQLQAESDRILDQAVEDGKIPPARRKHWASLMNADREGAIQQLAALEDNVIPINARGEGRQNGGEGDTTGQEGFGYPAGMFPEVAARKERVAAGARSRVQTDRG